MQQFEEWLPTESSNVNFKVLGHTSHGQLAPLNLQYDQTFDMRRARPRASHAHKPYVTANEQVSNNDTSILVADDQY